MKLFDILGKQKTVLVFYRGSWCPFCNVQLAALAMVEEEVSNAGYQIVAISPDDYENLQSMMDKNEIKYSLYSDPKGNLIQKMGLAFKLSEERIESLGKRTLGEVPELLPVPTLMIVNTEAEILFIIKKLKVKMTKLFVNQIETFFRRTNYVMLQSEAILNVYCYSC